MLLTWSIFCKFGTIIAINVIMRKIGYIFLLTVLVSVNSMAQEINWVSLGEAVELQKKNPGIPVDVRFIKRPRFKI